MTILQSFMCSLLAVSSLWSQPQNISLSNSRIVPSTETTTYDYSVYEAMLESYHEWGSEFVHYDDIRSLGVFRGFTCYIHRETNEPMPYYSYYLMDSEGIPFELYIFRPNSAHATTFATSEYTTHQMLKKGFASTPHIEATSISPYVDFSLYGNIFSGSDLGLYSVIIECDTTTFYFSRSYYDLEKGGSLLESVLLSEHKECGCLVSRLIDPDTTVSATNEFLQMVGLEEYCRKDITVLTDRYMCFRFVSTTALAAACFLAAIYLAWLCRKKLA